MRTQTTRPLTSVDISACPRTAATRSSELWTKNRHRPSRNVLPASPRDAEYNRRILRASDFELARAMETSISAASTLLRTLTENSRRLLTSTLFKTNQSGIAFYTRNFLITSQPTTPLTPRRWHTRAASPNLTLNKWKQKRRSAFSGKKSLSRAKTCPAHCFCSQLTRTA